MELLDNKRLAAQFVGLERRTGRSGKDSIAEPRGAHDDACNAVAGVLVGLDLDRRPALIKRGDILVEHQAIEMVAPRAIIGVLWVGLDGMAAYALFAYGDLPTGRLVLMDFDTLPWNGLLIEEIACRLDELCETSRNTSPAAGGIHCFFSVPAQLFDAAHSAMVKAFAPRLDRLDTQNRNIAPVAIDPLLLADPVSLVLGATANVAAGRVKLGAAALARSTGKPLLGSLAIKPGERVETDPLRVALLIGIAEIDPAPSQREGARAQFA